MIRSMVLAVIGFAAGWCVHRRRTYWAKVHVTGVLEQWIEQQCGHLLGTQSMEELDAIMSQVMRRQRMPSLLRTITRRKKRPERAPVLAVDPATRSGADSWSTPKQSALAPIGTPPEDTTPHA